MFQHSTSKSAVLLINLGSPDEPTTPALKRYLKEFLSDFRVIDLPRWKWWPILNGIILQTRPKKSAMLYQKIWTDEGSPLLVITEKQVKAIQEYFVSNKREHIIIDYAMRYGNPSIASKLADLKLKGVNQLLIIPMYPQYSDATTASVIDEVAHSFRSMRYMPEWRFIHHWHDHDLYISALADSYQEYCEKNGHPEKLLLSFHGVPKRYLEEGDPYFCFCHKTARLFREKLNLSNDFVELVFQSRFGSEPWLQPYTDIRLEELAKKGTQSVAVMCPGFSADCLETLEEIAETNRELFLNSGGKNYDYIPALNASPKHIELLVQLIDEHTNDWMRFQKEGLEKEKEFAMFADEQMMIWEKGIK
ncbi:ferrochelatase [Suttonella ornithocola]|uniref:Ferrochelatase n=1 Tax=Suttonella ornithocola TaxID=279832 RepID=A0A380MSQ6_9GAMM|nr:ferrochelatase [Suttonella ornithocola]SUO94741.1 Ferrochelatase [Suttonella ornithocola]